MPFPFIIAGAAAASGAGVAVLGMLLSPEDKMKHTQTPVTRILNLTPGDRISVKTKRDLPFRHGIVVEQLCEPTYLVRVVYHSGSKERARVTMMEVDLYEQAIKGELFRHQYEALICHPNEAVLARANSLYTQPNSSLKRQVPQIYWPFFKDDEHFADWCQIGFHSKDGLKAALWNDYKCTEVSDVARLSEGDHIVTDDGLSGIVVGVGEKMAQLEIVQFPSEQKRGAERPVVNNIARVKGLKRLDYDIAVGVSGQTAKDIAVREADQPTEPMPYSNPDQFAVWCKTQVNPVQPNVACELASARMMGRAWAWVRATDELTRGDHIAWKCGWFYYQHAIVSGIEDGEISICLMGNVKDISEMVIKSDKITDVSAYMEANQLCKYFYDVREGGDPDDIIHRAESLVGSTADTLPFKNQQHFAMYCKTGTYQLHC